MFMEGNAFHVHGAVQSAFMGPPAQSSGVLGITRWLAPRPRVISTKVGNRFAFQSGQPLCILLAQLLDKQPLPPCTNNNSRSSSWCVDGLWDIPQASMPVLTEVWQ